MPTMTIARKKRAENGADRPRFEDAARGVMLEVQNSFARLIAAIPTRSTISKAADLQKALGVDPKLGWKVFRVANAANALAAGPELPSRVSMQRLFKAAAKQRVPTKLIEQASTAFDRFEEVVSKHAGDRDSFASMVSALTGGIDGSDQIDLNQRRALFKGNSHVWGVQARSKMFCMIMQPNTAEPDMVDAVLLRGVVELRQLRRHRPFTISTMGVFDSDGVARRNPDIERLDVVDDRHGVNLLRDFCTQPLPVIRNVNQSNQLVTQLLNTDVGSGAAFTGFLCDVLRTSDVRYRDEHNNALELVSKIDNPFESALVDVLVRCGTYADTPLNFDAKIISTSGPKRPADVLFSDAPPAYLGLGADGLHTSGYPRYVEMIHYVMDRLGWDSGEFEAYRYRLEYPVMHTSVVVSCPLPEAPRTTTKSKSGKS